MLPGGVGEGEERAVIQPAKFYRVFVQPEPALKVVATVAITKLVVMFPARQSQGRDFLEQSALVLVVFVVRACRFVGRILDLRVLPAATLFVYSLGMVGAGLLTLVALTLRLQLFREFQPRLPVLLLRLPRNQGLSVAVVVVTGLVTGAGQAVAVLVHVRDFITDMVRTLVLFLAPYMEDRVVPGVFPKVGALIAVLLVQQSLRLILQLTGLL